MKKQIRTVVLAMNREVPIPLFSSSGYTDEKQFTAVKLCILSRWGLWNLLLFLMISMAAFSAQNLNFFAVFPEDLWSILGSPPPPKFIHLVLVIYLFCAVVMLPDRLKKASLFQGWSHVGYRTIFYFFYLTANVLANNFMVVFIAGLILYGLEQSYLFLHAPKHLLNENHR